MKNRLLFLIAISLLLFACGNRGVEKKTALEDSSLNQNLYVDLDSDGYSESEEEYTDLEDKIYDGKYCANITYYNSNTATKSKYTLIIEVHNNELEKINYPNGWLDSDHFYFVEFDENGYVSFKSDKGYNYTVQIIGESSGCFETVPDVAQCLGVTKEGRRCQKMINNLSKYCWQHEGQQ